MSFSSLTVILVTTSKVTEDSIAKTKENLEMLNTAMFQSLRNAMNTGVPEQIAKAEDDANQKEFEDEDDDRVFFIQELMDFLEIEIVEKERFKELKFSKLDEDFDETIFTSDELKSIHKVINLYKDTSVRNLSNECFSLEKVRKSENGTIVL